MDKNHPLLKPVAYRERLRVLIVRITSQASWRDEWFMINQDD